MAKKIRVLIIDEHPAVCEALAARLGAVPSMQVVGSVYELAEGVNGARLLRPDIVLLELKRSAEGKCSPAAIIASLLDNGAGRIIILTSYLDEAERDGAFAAGARRYLLKDIDTGRLVTEIEAVARESWVEQDFRRQTR